MLLSQTRLTPRGKRKKNANDNTTPASLVVVGNGMVGHRLLKQLSAQGGRSHYKVTVFGEEPHPAYDRVHLTNYLNDPSPENLTLAKQSWYEEQDVKLILGDPIQRIDRAERKVISQSGQEVPYDKLVLATGSSPFVPFEEGKDLPGVFVYRTIDDLEAIRQWSTQAKRAAVIGGGLLGLEAARALQKFNLKVHVVEYADCLMPMQLDKDGGQALEYYVKQLGIRLWYQKLTQKIQAVEEGLLLHFADDERLAVDMVVIAAGIRPRDELAKQCDLEIGGSGGVLVNEQLRSSDPNIFAIGECANYQGTRYGLVQPGYQMADVLALNLMGKKAKFTNGDNSSRLKMLGVDVVTLGQFQQAGDVVNYQSKGQFRQVVLKRGRLIGATAVGDWPEVSEVQAAVNRNKRLWPMHLKRFRQEGRLFRQQPVQPIQAWPDEAIVCNCLNVTCGNLRQCMTQGCATTAALAETTGASTMCGSCQPLLEELVGEPVSETKTKGNGGLIGASLLALFVLLGFGVLGPIPFADTVQGGWKIDTLWRNGLYKQISGFVLLGLMAAALGLSLRKRVKKVTFGDFGYWRLFHAVVGVLTLVGIVAHTGLHIGHNLNSLLMVCFLGLNLVGTFAGVLTGMASKPTGLTRNLQRLLTQAHILFFWPLPTLIVFHIFSAYYF